MRRRHWRRGASLFALRPQHQTIGTELYNTNNGTTPDGLADLPRDYTGFRGLCRSSDNRCQAISARHLNAGAAGFALEANSARAAARPGTGSRTHQPSLRHHERHGVKRNRSFDDLRAASSSEHVW
jgi:hypothetical protein